MSFRSPSPGVTVLAGVLVAGCAIGPDYKRPQIDAPVPVTAAMTLDHQRQLTRWWQRFGDPKLEAMTERAASENLSIRYQEGLISFIELLDARRTPLDAELALSKARREQLTAAATLLKALGGGWSREP
ncbi:MAG: hypothetical protein HZY77_07180 [Thiobacillus sp.]|uniref:hypothetical protein n=1 Tax=Thiobacillus sp. TaxID=924 RepID=UPI00168CAC69|nr:hypothetical protein [Thiobacillus sp.]QLQ02630.1 MAG: hypothetical protein HZY77_07180 [Thiobacillus sp.]